MPLSDRELKVLLEKAADVQKTGEAVGYALSLRCLNRVIENAPPHPHYFVMRSQIKYNLACRSMSYNFDSAIDDLNSAINLDPDKGEYYQMRGKYLLEKLGEAGEGEKEKILIDITANYKSSLERNPINSDAWLGLIEVSILLGNWDEAISVYGQSKPYTDDKKDRLIRAWLGCLALIFAGDTPEDDDMEPLFDKDTQLSGIEGNVSGISNFLAKISDKEPEKWSKAIEVHNLFKEHRSWRSKLFDRSTLYNYKFRTAKERGNLLALNSEYADEQAFCAISAPDISNDPIKMLALYEEELNRNQKDIRSWYNKACILMDWGYSNDTHNEKALIAFEKMLELKPDEAMGWYNRGVILERLERYEEALESFDKVLELETSDMALAAWAWVGKGRICGYAHDSVKFIREKEDLSRVLYGGISKCDNLSEAYRASCEKALEAYGEAIKLMPNFADAWYQKAGILFDIDRFNEALECYDKAVNARVCYSLTTGLLHIASFERANLYFRIERYEEALKHYTSILFDFGLDECGEIWERVGHTFFALKRYEEALNAYDKILEKINGYSSWIGLDGRTWLNKGIVYKETGRYKEAIEACGEAIKAWSSDSLGRRKLDIARLGWPQIGCIYKKLRRYREALEAYDKAVDPDGAEYTVLLYGKDHYAMVLYSKARVFSLTGKKKDMILSLSTAIEENSDYKEKAGEEDDFKNFWDDPYFKALTY